MRQPNLVLRVSVPKRQRGRRRVSVSVREDCTAGGRERAMRLSVHDAVALLLRLAGSMSLSCGAASLACLTNHAGRRRLMTLGTAVSDAVSADQHNVHAITMQQVAVEVRVHPFSTGME